MSGLSPHDFGQIGNGLAAPAGAHGKSGPHQQGVRLQGIVAQDLGHQCVRLRLFAAIDQQRG